MLQVDAMSTTDQTGVTLVANPNSQRRVISDAQSVQTTVQLVNLTDRTTGSGPSWSVGDQFVVNVVGLLTGHCFWSKNSSCIYCNQFRRYSNKYCNSNYGSRIRKHNVCVYC